MDNKKPKEKRKTVTVAMPESEYDRLAEYAKEKMLPLSTYLRWLLIKHINQKTK